MTNIQLSNLPDDQIRSIAHNIWLARQESGEPGNADTDWQAAVNEFSGEINKLTTKKSNLIKKYGIGLAVLLGLVAMGVIAKLKLF